MGLVTNETRFSQTEIPNRNFPKFFVNGKRPWKFRVSSELLNDIGFAPWRVRPHRVRPHYKISISSSPQNFVFVFT